MDSAHFDSPVPALGSRGFLLVSITPISLSMSLPILGLAGCNKLHSITRKICLLFDGQIIPNWSLPPAEPAEGRGGLSGIPCLAYGRHSARQGSERLNCFNFALTGLWISTTMCDEKSIDPSLGGRAGGVLLLAPSLQQGSFIQSSGKCELASFCPRTNTCQYIFSNRMSQGAVVWALKMNAMTLRLQLHEVRLSFLLRLFSIAVRKSVSNLSRIYVRATSCTCWNV